MVTLSKRAGGLSTRASKGKMEEGREREGERERGRKREEKERVIKEIKRGARWRYSLTDSG